MAELSAVFGADTTSLDRTLATLKAKLSGIRAVDVPVKLETSKALADLGGMWTTAEALGIKLPVETKGLPEAEEKVDRTARDRTVNLNARIGKGFSMLTTMLIGLGPSVLPVLAAVTAGIGAMGASALAAGGAAGILGIAVAGQITAMKKAKQQIDTDTKSLAGMERGTDSYRRKAKALAAEQANFNKTYGQAAVGLGAFKRAWADFLKATSGTTNSLIATGLSQVAAILPRLVPVVRAAGHGVQVVLDMFGAWATGPQATRLLTFFRKSGPGAIISFGTAAKNVLHGLISLVMLFAPYQKKVTDGFVGWTKSFSTWAGNLHKTDGFAKFIGYIKGILPTVVSLFKNAATFVARFATALGPLGGLELKGLTAVLGQLNRLPIPVLSAFAAAITGIVLAYKAWTLATKIQTIATELSTKGTLANSAATKIAAAAQWLFNAALDANPIGIVVVALAALAAGIVIAYKKSATFRAIVQGLWGALQAGAKAFASFFTRTIPAAFTSVIGFVTKHWKVFAIGLATILLGPLGGLVALVVTHFSQIKKFIVGVVGDVLDWVRKHWKLIVSIIGGPIGAVAVFVASHWSQIKSTITGAVSAVIGFLQSHWKLIVSIITGPIGAIVVFATTHWNQIKGIFTSGVSRVVGIVKSLPGRIKSALGDLSHLLCDAGKAVIQGFINGIDSMFRPVKDKLSSLGHALTGWKGPPAYDRQVLTGNGQLVIEGFIRGLESRYGAVRRSLGRLTGDLGRTRLAAPEIGAIPAGRAYGGGIDYDQLAAAVARRDGRTSTGPAPVAQQFTVYQQPGESTDQLAERLWFKTRRGY